jgi:hypothetical protein
MLTVSRRAEGQHLAILLIFFALKFLGIITMAAAAVVVGGMW